MLHILLHDLLQVHLHAGHNVVLFLFRPFFLRKLICHLLPDYRLKLVSMLFSEPLLLAVLWKHLVLFVFQMDLLQVMNLVDFGFEFRNLASVLLQDFVQRSLLLFLLFKVHVEFGLDKGVHVVVVAEHLFELVLVLRPHASIQPFEPVAGPEPEVVGLGCVDRLRVVADPNVWEVLRHVTLITFVFEIKII